MNSFVFDDAPILKEPGGFVFLDENAYVSKTYPTASEARKAFLEYESKRRNT